MAIHVSERNPSPLDYEDWFRDVKNDIRLKMSKIPKRRWDSIARPLLEATNRAFDIIMRIEEDPIRGTKTGPTERYKLVIAAQREIKRMEKPLWIWWAISSQRDEEDVREQKWKQRANLCEKINRILGRLHEMQKASARYDPGEDRGETTVRYFTESEIEKAEFLKKMRELLRMTHRKVIGCSRITRDAEGRAMAELINKAFYFAVTGNKCRTYLPEEMKMRKECFRKTMSALKRAERYLFNILAAESMSNREMEEWTGLMNESVRMMAAVYRSDRKTG